MIEKRYYWRILTEDGLLKTPKDEGPYYDTFNVNPVWEGYYTSEEAAYQGLEDFSKRYAKDYGGLAYHMFVLITECGYKEDDNG